MTACSHALLAPRPAPNLHPGRHCHSTRVTAGTLGVLRICTIGATVMHCLTNTPRVPAVTRLEWIQCLARLAVGAAAADAAVLADLVRALRLLQCACLCLSRLVMALWVCACGGVRREEAVRALSLTHTRAHTRHTQHTYARTHARTHTHAHTHIHTHNTPMQPAHPTGDEPRRSACRYIIHKYVYGYRYRYIYLYIHTYIDTYIDRYRYRYRYLYVHTYMHRSYIHTYIDTYIDTYIYVDIHA